MNNKDQINKKATNENYCYWDWYRRLVGHNRKSMNPTFNLIFYRIRAFAFSLYIREKLNSLIKDPILQNTNLY